MSAFLLPNQHINALLSFAKSRVANYTLRAGKNSYALDKEGDFLAVGKILRQANEKSLKARYDNGFDEDIDNYPYIAQIVPILNLKFEDIINACDCFHYQSCEDKDYPSSEAFAIINAIKDIAVKRLIAHTPKVWVIDDLQNPSRI